MNIPTPTFRPIDTFPGYFVSDDGVVLSYRSPKQTQRLCPVVLKPRAGKYGHCSVQLCRDGNEPQSFLVHALVMAAFVGPRPPQADICHNNGNPMDNRLSNLRYDTHKNNHADQQLHGTSNAGSKNGRSKLTAERVADIRMRLARGEHRNTVAVIHGITETTVRDIKTGRSWGHLVSST